jgi:sugar lactone lactonase YvrE
MSDQRRESATPEPYFDRTPRLFGDGPPEPLVYGLALSPDGRTMYVANTRSSQYIHAIRLDAGGHMVGRSIFADLNEGSEPGIPDGLKVDSSGRVYCTGPGGIWVMAPG